MNYNGINCAYCGKKFEQNDDVVVCPVCGTPHHRSCWTENGRCVNADKHIEGYIWQNTAPAYQPAPEVKNGMKICPACGQENEQFEPVCTRCGERLKNTAQTPYVNTEPQYGNWNQAREFQYNPYQNVYAQDARTLYGDNAEIDGISVTEMAEYIQKNSNKYIDRFMSMKAKNTKFSWNWSAALLSVYWCFYRKMIGLGIALLVIVFSLNVATDTLVELAYQKLQPEVYAEYLETYNEIINASEDIEIEEYYGHMSKFMLSPVSMTNTVVSAAITLLVSVVMGFVGNYFYKKKIIKDINTIRRVATDNTVYHIYLRQKGSVSVVNLLLPMVFNSMLNMLMNAFLTFF